MTLPVQARSTDTRRRLIEAGIVAFSQRGHDAVNLTSDVLEPAGVSVGSFYHQFADKTELLIAILDEAADERLRAVVPSTPARTERRSLESDIGEAVERFFVSLDDEGHLWRIQVRERANTEPRIQERIRRGRVTWRTGISRIIAPHNRRDDDALALAVEMIVALCVGLIATYLDLTPEQRSARRRSLPAQVASFICDGIRPMIGAPGRSSARPVQRGR